MGLGWEKLFKNSPAPANNSRPLVTNDEPGDEPRRPIPARSSRAWARSRPANRAETGSELAQGRAHVQFDRPAQRRSAHTPRRHRVFVPQHRGHPLPVLRRWPRSIRPWSRSSAPRSPISRPSGSSRPWRGARAPAWRARCAHARTQRARRRAGGPVGAGQGSRAGARRRRGGGFGSPRGARGSKGEARAHRAGIGGQQAAPEHGERAIALSEG